jgi:hypothetical protein
METIKVKFTDLPKNTDTPIFTYCRKLIEEGVNPDTRLEVYRESDTWDIAVSNIGIGAETDVKRTSFVKYHPRSIKNSADRV